MKIQNDHGQANKLPLLWLEIIIRYPQQSSFKYNKIFCHTVKLNIISQLDDCQSEESSPNSPMVEESSAPENSAFNNSNSEHAYSTGK